MTEESTPRALSLNEAVQALRQSREDHAKPETSPEEANPEAEEVREDHAEAEEAEESTPQDEQQDDAAPDGAAEASDEDLYEVDGVQFTRAELHEWKRGTLREADYTRKTQELAETRKGFEAERAQWDAERDAAIESIRQQQAQLKTALATFAVEQDPEPKPEGLTWEAYTRQKTAWDKRQVQKAQARDAFHALQAEQTNEVLQRETAQLLRHFPGWKDPAVFASESKALASVAGKFGFSDADINGVMDHRIFRVLSELNRLMTAEGQRKASEAAAVQKVAKAAKLLTPGASVDGKNQATKDLRQKRDQLHKSGSLADAVALLQAKRAAR